jgi:hypothetical protein
MLSSITAYEQGTAVLYMQQGCGETCGDMNKAQAPDLCKHGILTGRGLHKSPLTAETLLHCLAHNPSIFAPGASFRLRDPAGFVFLPLLALLPDSSFGCSLHGRKHQRVWVETFSASSASAFVTGLHITLQLIPAVPRRALETECRIFLAGWSSFSIVSPRRCMPRRTYVGNAIIAGV